MVSSGHREASVASRIAQLSPERRELMARLLRERTGAGQGIARRPDPLAPAPLSYAQQRLWFLSQLEPDNLAYTILFLVPLPGPWDPTALDRALAELLRRHEALRTTFAAPDGQPLQIVGPATTPDTPVVDLRSCTPAEQAARIAHIQEAARQPFDLGRSPLRVLLIRSGEREQTLLAAVHHIAFDGASMAIFRRELTALYAAFTTGTPSPLPELPIQYGDYAAWQRAWLQGEVLERQITYWRRQLAGLSTLDLPTDRARPPVQRFRGAARVVALPADLVSRLKAIGQAEGATLFMTLLAAFQVLLARYCAQNDIVVGSPVTGRTHEELEGLIGLFANTVALRTDLSGDPTFPELLRRVRDTVIDANAHHAMPFERLVTEFAPQRDLSRNPLFQVLFTLHTGREDLTDPVGDAEMTLLDNTSARFDLELELAERPQGITGTLQYDTDLYEAGTMGRLWEQYRTLLAGVAA
ncbi:MAG TPA: condensation domain-containing protein, partial [Chloroflexota bacterium]|nr:condensation domain-containing protein [Chloroflexota bacterium]